MASVWNTMKRYLLCGCISDNRLHPENEMEMTEGEQAVIGQRPPPPMLPQPPPPFPLPSPQPPLPADNNYINEGL